ncbi:Eukaryotic translation initiation factor 3 subunit A [Armadillidium vulgare]|nr:Eukaryotic translation initiation factor 3 subunit A [Armadillidium vulgare]
MSRSYQRPENALKRANEFIDVGKPSRALEVLYEVIKRGKMRTNYSEKLLEPIMFKYLELCVDLKKSHLAKEGLYQYRNIFQSVNVSSLETVVKFYLELADEKTESARKESHQAVVDIDDLDNLATPEEILLSAVSGEDAQDRSDRTILTPWVKFLWESYRQCLELLRTNSRVEKLYHNIAQHAFKFCEKYNRKTEFRKLCDNLRVHLTHIQKQQGSATAVNLNNPETQQLNLETRLEQLNYAIKMELWQEAYKAIEDISDLMKKSKKMPKPHVMASYYEKLALVFWKAGNHLFHAAALFKLFQLLRDQKKNITPDELSKRASIVLVATLAIPLPSAHPEFDRFIETEKSALEKIERLANLLSLSKPPTRESLIKDLVRMNVVNSVPIELQNMYQLMEVEFDPLHLCCRMQVHLNWIKEKPDSGLPQYIAALQEMTITRLVKQVAQVYQTITFIRLLELSVFITPFHLERILVDLVRHNDLQIRIDHRTSCVHFGVDLSESQREDLPEGPTLQALPSETIRCQLVHMSSALQKCLSLIAPDKMEPIRAQTIQLYHQTRQRDHQRILQRQHIIEERKEMLENQNLEREEQLRKAQEEQLKRQKEEEQERLRREASKRERERHEEQLKQIHTKQIKDKLMQISKTSYGQKMIEKIDKEELLNLGAEEILQRQVEELEKERKELQKKLKSQEKNVDYFERARRLIEIPRLKKSLEMQREKDKDFWETQEQERVSRLIEEHRVALEHSQRLYRMLPDRDIFVEKLTTARHSEIQKKLNDFNARLEEPAEDTTAPGPWRPKKASAWRQKEQEKLDVWRVKEEEREPLSERLSSRDIRKDEPPREKPARREDEPWRDEGGPPKDEPRREERNDWRSGPRILRDEKPPMNRDTVDRGIDGDKDKDIEKPPPARDMERGPVREKEFERGSPPPRDRERDFDKGPPPRDRGERDFERGPPSRDRGDRDFERGPPRDFDRGHRGFDRGSGSRNFDRGPRDRDFERGPPRDRDFERGPSRDFERGPPRDFERGPPRDFERGPPRDRDRDFERGSYERGPSRDFRGGRDRDFERGPARDFDRGPRDGGRFRDKDGGPSRADEESSWRRSEPLPEPKKDGFRRLDREDGFRRGDREDGFRRGDRENDFKRGDREDGFRRGDREDFKRGDRESDFKRGDRENDFKRGDREDFKRGDRENDFKRGDRENDFKRGDRENDFKRGDRENDFKRGDRENDFKRGDRENDFKRGDRETDFKRGDRENDFKRGDRENDFKRGDRETDFKRGDKEDGFRRGDRKEDGFKRGDKGEPRKVFNSVRDGPSDEPIRKGDKRDELPKGPKEEAKPRRPKEETDEDGWTKVRR